MPALDTDRFCLTEDSASMNRLDPSTIQCLGIVKSKGRKRHLESSDASGFKRGRAMSTRWGPCILKAKCKDGWNVDFRDGHAGGWFVDMHDFVAC